MTRQEIVKRARSAVGKGTRYHLGKGGFNPHASRPADNGQLDCSGFVAWALGISRDQTGKFSLNWIETSRVYQDATTHHELFVKTTDPEPGDVIVYPDRNGHEGHIGIIGRVTNSKPDRVIHCNASSKPDAIAETPVQSFWRDRGAIYARFKGANEEREDSDLKPMKIVTVNGKKTAYKAALDEKQGTHYLPLAAIKDLLKPGVTVSYDENSVDFLTEKK